jgi:SAM-dependent methyltransferase
VSERIAPPAAQGFSRAADAYDRGRPDYPAEVVRTMAARFDLRPGRTVLDLAAGTGKLTRPLLGTGARVIAVEPVAEMRARLPAEVEALDGVAESIPLPDGAVDAVTAGQAFHWFRPPEALREIHRVLRPRGGLALVWNIRDERDPLQRAISELLDPLCGETPQAAHTDASARIAESGRFGPVEELRLPHSQELDADGLVDRFLSVSFVAAAPAERRREIEDGLRRLVASRPQPIRLAYTTKLYVARRLEEPPR